MPVAEVDSTVLRDRLQRWGEDLVAQASEMIVAELREAAPLGQTGDTRRGIEAMPGGSPLRPSVTVVSRGKGGTFVEEGTAPHEIRPRNASVLRFLGGSGRISQPGPNQRIATRAGGVVFAKVVHHPGTPARPWFGPVVERFVEFLERAKATVQA